MGVEVGVWKECGWCVGVCVGHTHQRHGNGGGRNVWEERWAYVPLKREFLKAMWEFGRIGKRKHELR